VPEDFGKEIRGEEVAGLLRDEIAKFVKEGRTAREVVSTGADTDNYTLKPIIPSTTEPEVSVAGATFSPRYFADVLRSLFGRGYTRFSGELTDIAPDSATLPAPKLCPELSKSKRKVRLVLRVSDGTDAPFFEGEGSYEAVAACGALAALIIDPYSAAAYLGDRTDNPDPAPKRQALALLASALSRSKREEAPISLENEFGLHNDVPRGELIRANILLNHGCGLLQ